MTKAILGTVSLPPPFIVINGGENCVDITATVITRNSSVVCDLV